MLEEQQEIEQSEQGKIIAETARIPWQDLQLFYAKGMAILVSPELDLVKVAHSLSLDEKEKIEQWIEEGKLLRLFDERAKLWAETNVEVWGVVVKPWVLVQEVKC